MRGNSMKGIVMGRARIMTRCTIASSKGNGLIVILRMVLLSVMMVEFTKEHSEIKDYRGEVHIITQTAENIQDILRKA